MEVDENIKIEREHFNLSPLELPEKSPSSLRDDVAISCLHVSTSILIYCKLNHFRWPPINWLRQWRYSSI